MGDHARILIVDDDETIRKVTSAVLEEKGYLVETAENGEEALRKTEEKFYNLALIDFRLPDIPGTELLTRMKETKPRMVKIIITGFPSLQNAIGAVNKNADSYLIKPVKIDELLITIQDHLEMQEEARKYDEERIAEFIEMRIKELNTPIKSD